MTMQDCIVAARRAGPLPQSDGTHLFEFEFGADAHFFAGHFPGRPLLPGVFQLEMARLAVEWVLQCALTIQEISKAKFQRPILPGETVRMKLKCSEENASIRAGAIFSVSEQAAGETVLRLTRKPI